MNISLAHKLARHISDMGWGELGRHLGYKSEIRGNKFVRADRFYASSKACSSCGHINQDLTLSDRIFRCSVCGLEIDRDLNAGRNLKNFMAQTTAGYAGSDVCGEERLQGRRESVVSVLLNEAETFKHI